MARWFKWRSLEGTAEQKQSYGDGPFILLSELDQVYTVLLPMNIPRVWLEETTEGSIWLEQHVKNAVSASGGCKKSCRCSCSDEPHPLAGLRVGYDPKHVSESPFTSDFRPGQAVSTPHGSGTVERITWRQVQVGGILYDAHHVTPTD